MALTKHTSFNLGLVPTMHRSQIVVGAYIQLLLHSSEVITAEAGTYRKTAAKIASKLHAQQAMGTVKDPHAIELLEVFNLFQGRAID